MILGQVSFQNSEETRRKQQVGTRPAWEPAAEAVSRRKERDSPPSNVAGWRWLYENRPGGGPGARAD